MAVQLTDDEVRQQMSRSVRVQDMQPNRVTRAKEEKMQTMGDLMRKLEAETLEARATRTFETGATRDTDEGKLDYEGFLSEPVLRRYAEYMHKNRIQSDGKVRDSDNWQKGMPIVQYMKSLWRHFMDVWRHHRHGLSHPEHAADWDAEEEALCGVMFNSMGMLHELLKRRNV